MILGRGQGAGSEFELAVALLGKGLHSSIPAQLAGAATRASSQDAAAK